MTRTLITNGLLIDGITAEPQHADLLVVDQVIAHIAPRGTFSDREPETTRIDVTGSVVSPGFIDTHTHSDVSLLAAPEAESKVLQGVTTEIVGNCSFSAFPGVPETAAALDDHLSRLGGPAVPASWADLRAYAREVDHRKPSVNVAALVGHGALRIAALADPFGPASPADIERMGELLDAEMSAGALGFSTGLTHTPSSHADAAEIHALASVCARYGGVYATHSRANAHNEFGAVREAIAVSAETGVRLQYSHAALNNPENWGSAHRVLELFHEAADAGLPVGFDVYPYTASSSALIQYLPEWVQHGGGAALAEANRSSSWRSRAIADITRGWFGGIAWHWDRVVIVDAPGEETLAGLSLQDIAHLRNVPPEQALLDLCVRHGSAIQAVLHYRIESDVQDFIRDPLGIIASDGLALPLQDGPGLPHPRSFGTFPRVLGRYVRDRGTIGLVDAVRKLSAEPARRFGIPQRGTLSPGAPADIVVFDPAVVADQATFSAPRQAPLGISHTFVAGELVAHCGVRVPRPGPGRFLRRTT